MKKRYILIYEFNYDTLEKRVDAAMEQGYVPHGSLVFRPAVCTAIHHSVEVHAKSAFIQPMVLK